MKILLINQAFYPDIVAVAQYLTDLTPALVSRGHDVTVMSGNHGYDDPSQIYPSSEEYRGIKIKRIRYSSFGKKRKLFRLFDLLTFHLKLILALCVMGQQDVVISMTSPPFIGLWGQLFCRFRGGRHLYWVMDMHPDEAVAAQWIREGSLLEKVLCWFARQIYLSSDQIIVLDEYMKLRICSKYGISERKIAVIPPWALDDYLHVMKPEDTLFRKRYALENKFVVMYSGNHSVCHPLDTLLQAALFFWDDPDIIFCFVGGGVQTTDVAQFKKTHSLPNILQLSYQPVDQLSDSLGAADLHVTVMGEPFVGIVHPCKAYGVLAIGKPLVFIGPARSPIGDFIKYENVGFQVEHGDVQGLVEVIEKVRNFDSLKKQEIEDGSLELKDAAFGKKQLVAELISIIENKWDHKNLPGAQEKMDREVLLHED